jgi:hypothetical protein
MYHSRGELEPTGILTTTSESNFEYEEENASSRSIEVEIRC